jgi:hypothetical protein
MLLKVVIVTMSGTTHKNFLLFYSLKNSQEAEIVFRGG